MNYLSDEQRRQSGWIGDQKCEDILKRALSRSEQFVFNKGVVEVGRQIEEGKNTFILLKSGKLKWLIGVALILIVIHAAVGFLLLPYLVKHQLVNQFDKQFGREASIESVRVNPYTLTLTIRKFSLNDPDGQAFVGFDEFYGNYQLFTFIKKIWSFKQIRLKRPVVNIRMNKAGEINFADLLPRAEKPRSEDGQGDPARVSFDRIAIETGRVSFIDQKRPNEFFQRILDPIDFELTNLSTLPDQQGMYSLLAHTVHDEWIQWAGKITVNPLWSEGHLKIAGVKKPKLWAYLRELLNVEISSAGLDLELSYRLDGRNRSTQLALDDVTYMVKDFSLKSVEGEDELLSFHQLKIAGGRLRWPENKVEIEKVYFSGIRGKAWLNEQGVLNWQELFAAETKEEREPPGESKSAQASVSVTMQTALKQWYLEQFSTQGLEALKAKHMISKQQETDGKSQKSSEPKQKSAQSKLQLDTASFYSAVRSELIQTQKVTESELRQLGKARAENIKAYLVSEGTVEAKRIFILEPKAAERDANKNILCELSVRA